MYGVKEQGVFQVTKKREIHGFAVYRTPSPPIRWVVIDEKSHVDGPVNHGSFKTLAEAKAAINRIWAKRLAPVAPAKAPVHSDVRHINDLRKEWRGKFVGHNDDGSFIAPDGMMWMELNPRRKGWFSPIAKVQGWRS